jgi:hypothetical protein
MNNVIALCGTDLEDYKGLTSDPNYVVMDPQDPLHDEKLRYLKSVRFDSAQFVKKYGQTTDRVKSKLGIAV